MAEEKKNEAPVKTVEAKKPVAKKINWFCAEGQN